MFNVKQVQRFGLVFTAFMLFCAPAVFCGQNDGQLKIYVPYEQLKDVIGQSQHGVFLPNDEFQKLWDAAHKSPADVGLAPVPYLISAARFTGQVSGNIARMHMELTVDILADGWIELPIGLGEVAVDKVSIKPVGEKSDAPNTPEMLQICGDGYKLLTKGKGRRVINVDFVRQLSISPGLHELSYRLPTAAINTLELLIPEENMKVDVTPMHAATTSQVTVDGKKCTRLQAFLGSSATVTLSWKPSTQAAETLEPVIVCNQLQTIRVDEAMVNYTVEFNYDVLRRGVDGFTVQLPADFRVINVSGENIAKWNIITANKMQSLKVSLFAPAKGKYKLTVEMERFLKQGREELTLSPIITHNVLRRTGLIAITHSPRRSVEMLKTANLARVDAGRLPQGLQQNAVAYRFISADYSGVLAVDTVEPRVSVTQFWALGVNDDKLSLQGRLVYDVKKIGVFQLKMKFPEPWKIESVTPENTVEDYELSGKGSERELKILLRQELQGQFELRIHATQKRSTPTSPADFTLPLPDAKNLEVYNGQVLLALTNRFRAEVAVMTQFQPVSLRQANIWTSRQDMLTAMAFSFQAIDRTKPADLKFNIIARPTQVQAAVYRLINIQAGNITQSAVVDYNILYAPIDTLYLQMPASLADDNLQINGGNIKEWPRLDKLPADLQSATPNSPIKWAYYKIVLQTPVTGYYRLSINTRKAFSPTDEPQKIDVLPILAAGKISDQQGYIAIAKDESLAIVQPQATGLIPADPGSENDMPYAPYRQMASMAYKYNLAEKTDNVFSLSFSIIRQKAAAVITTMASACAIEQALGRDGTLNSHVTFRIKTRRGDRLPITLPKGAKIFGVMLNGAEAPVESADGPDVRIIRLPPSSGAVENFNIEITYSQTGKDACLLQSPTLPESVPVQETLWRIWLPQEDVLLGYDRDYSVVTSAQLWQLTQHSQLSPGSVFRLPASGKEYNFFRQGESRQLRLWTMRSEWFCAAVWGVVVLAGVIMLKIGGFRRCVILVILMLAAAVMSLYLPLLVRRAAVIGWPAGVLVLTLWIAQWIFAWARKPVAKVPPVSACTTDGPTNASEQVKE